MALNRRQGTRASAGVEFHHPIAFWVGALATTLGVLFHFPLYLSMADRGYEMVGMGDSPLMWLMWVGMALIVGGLLLATWGLVPRLRSIASAGPTSESVFSAAEDSPLSAAHWTLFFALTTALVVDVLKPATIGFVVPGMREEYGLSTTQVAAVPAIALTGTMLGSLWWGYMGDRIGRRATILLAALMFIATTTCGAMPTYNLNLAMCFFMGVSAGGLLPIVYALLAESVPAGKRGILAVLQGGLGTALGYLAASGLAALLVPEFGWRMLWFANLPTGVLILVLNRWIPESPRFLVERGRFAEAHETMARYGISLREEQENALAASKTSTAVGDESNPRPTHDAGIGRLFGASFRRQTATIGLYALSWGLVYWGFITLLPTMLKDTAALDSSAGTLLFWSALLAIPGTLLVALLYGVWSSRKTMVLYGGTTVCALVAFAILDPANGNSIVLSLLLVVLLAGSSGIIAMLSPYAAEIYPTDVRATGSGFTAACSKAGGMFGPPLIGAVLIAFPGFMVVSVLAAIPMAVATLIVAFAALETRGRNLEDIHEEAGQRARVTQDVS